MSIKEDLILVARVSSASGIQGNVVIKSLSSPKTNIIKMNLVDKLQNKVTIKLLRENSNGDLICKFNDISNRNDAEKLKNHKIFCARSHFPKLSDEEFYIEDLKGLLVVNNNLVSIGKIVNIFNFGAGDIVEIEFTNSKKVELFPFHKNYFPIITNDYAVFINN